MDLSPAFREITDALVSVEHEFGSPSHELVRVLVNMLVDGSFDRDENFRIKNDKVLHILLRVFPDLDDKGRRDLVATLSNLMESTENLCICSKQNLFSPFVDLLPLAGKNDLVVFDSILEIVRRLGEYNVDVSNVKKFLSLVHVEREAQGKHLEQYIKTLAHMSIAKPGPRQFWLFDGIHTGLSLPPFTKWPSGGYCFGAWVRIESWVDRMDRPFYHPRFFSCTGKEGGGVELFFKSRCLHARVMQQNKRAPAPTPLKYEFKLKTWYLIVVTHTHHRVLTSEMSLYVDGMLRDTVSMRYPSTSQTLKCCFIGTNIPIVNEYVSDIPRQSSLYGQIGMTFMYKDVLSADVISSLFSKGPDYAPGVYFDETAYTSKLIFSYSPRESIMMGGSDGSDGSCGSCGSYGVTSRGSTITDLCGNDRHAQLLPGALAERGRQTMQDAIHCAGGLELLLPCLATLEDFRGGGGGGDLQLPLPLHHDITPRTLYALADLMKNNDVNQVEFHRSGGFSIVGLFLTRMNPCNLALELLPALDAVIGSIRFPPLRAEVYLWTLFNFEVWIRAPVDVHLTVLRTISSQVGKNHKRCDYFRSLFGVCDFFAVLRAYYRYDDGDDGDLCCRGSLDDIALLRSEILMGIITTMVTHDITKKEVIGMVQSLLDNGDHLQVMDILAFLMNLMVLPRPIHGLFENLVDLGGPVLFFPLLSSKHEAIRVAALKVIGKLLWFMTERSKEQFFAKYGNGFLDPLKEYEFTTLTYSALLEILVEQIDLNAKPLLSMVKLPIVDDGVSSSSSSSMAVGPNEAPMVVALDGSQEFRNPLILSSIFSLLGRPSTVFVLTQRVMQDMQMFLIHSPRCRTVLLQHGDWQRWLFTMLFEERFPIPSGDDGDGGPSSSSSTAAQGEVVQVMILRLVMIALQHRMGEKDGWVELQKTLLVLKEVGSDHQNKLVTVMNYHHRSRRGGSSPLMKSPRRSKSIGGSAQQQKAKSMVHRNVFVGPERSISFTRKSPRVDDGGVSPSSLMASATKSITRAMQGALVEIEREIFLRILTYVEQCWAKNLANATISSLQSTSLSSATSTSMSLFNKILKNPSRDDRSNLVGTAWDDPMCQNIIHTMGLIEEFVFSSPPSSSSDGGRDVVALYPAEVMVTPSPETMRRRMRVIDSDLSHWSFTVRDRPDDDDDDDDDDDGLWEDNTLVQRLLTVMDIVLFSVENVQGKLRSVENVRGVRGSGRNALYILMRFILVSLHHAHEFNASCKRLPAVRARIERFKREFCRAPSSRIGLEKVLGPLRLHLSQYADAKLAETKKQIELVRECFVKHCARLATLLWSSRGKKTASSRASEATTAQWVLAYVLPTISQSRRLGDECHTALLPLVKKILLVHGSRMQFPAASPGRSGGGGATSSSSLENLPPPRDRLDPDAPLEEALHYLDEVATGHPTFEMALVSARGEREQMCQQGELVRRRLSTLASELRRVEGVARETHHQWETKRIAALMELRRGHQTPEKNQKDQWIIARTQMKEAIEQRWERLKENLKRSKSSPWHTTNGDAASASPMMVYYALDTHEDHLRRRWRLKVNPNGTSHEDARWDAHLNPSRKGGEEERIIDGDTKRVPLLSLPGDDDDDEDGDDGDESSSQTQNKGPTRSGPLVAVSAIPKSKQRQMMHRRRHSYSIQMKRKDQPRPSSPFLFRRTTGQGPASLPKEVCRLVTPRPMSKDEEHCSPENSEISEISEASSPPLTPTSPPPRPKVPPSSASSTSCAAPSSPDNVSTTPRSYRSRRHRLTRKLMSHHSGHVSDDPPKVSCKCELVRPLMSVPGVLEICADHFYFFVDRTCEAYAQVEAEFGPQKDRGWCISSVVAIQGRRYLLRDSAAEVFLDSCKSIFIHFSNGSPSRARDSRKRVARLLSQYHPGPRKVEVALGNPRTWLKSKDWTQQWQRGEMSNFEYLMRLNTAAGRTYHDLTQYPVFPWILCDYESDTLDLSNAKVYRDLSKPVGALNPERLADFLERYEAFSDPDIPKFHYGSHYSSVGSVLFYLLRVEPFATHFIALQSGRFDNPDRLFSSLPSAWANVLRSPSDVKELIPEFFYMPEMLRNNNRLELGVKAANEEPVDDVVLPPWAKSPEHFIETHRLALESSHVSAHLHEWIDLIFGFKQRGQAAIDANNVFYYLTYDVDLDAIEDPIMRKAVEIQIANFGQTPRQLFQTPHPKRLANAHRKSTAFPPRDSLVSSRIASPYVEPFLYTPIGRSPPALVSLLEESEELHVVGQDGSVVSYRYFSGTPNGQGLPFTIKPSDGKACFPGSNRLVKPPYAMVHANGPGGAVLAGCEHHDHTVVVMDQRGGFVQRFGWHKARITCMEWKGGFLVTGSMDATLCVWFAPGIAAGARRERGAPVVVHPPRHVLRGHDGGVTCCAVADGLDVVVSGSMDGSCLVHGLRCGRVLREIVLTHPGSPVRNVAICPIALRIFTQQDGVSTKTHDDSSKRRDDGAAHRRRSATSRVVVVVAGDRKDPDERSSTRNKRRKSRSGVKKKKTRSGKSRRGGKPTHRRRASSFGESDVASSSTSGGGGGNRLCTVLSQYTVNGEFICSVPAAPAIGLQVTDDGRYVLGAGKALCVRRARDMEEECSLYYHVSEDTTSTISSFLYVGGGGGGGGVSHRSAAQVIVGVESGRQADDHVAAPDAYHHLLIYSQDASLQLNPLNGGGGGGGGSS